MFKVMTRERNDGLHLLWSNVIKPCTTEKFSVHGCLRKKYDVADYRYFTNGITHKNVIFSDNIE